MWAPVTYSTRMSVKKEISRQMFRLHTNLEYSSKYGMNYTTKYKKVGSNYTTMTVNSVIVLWTFSICFNNSSLLAKDVLHSLQGCFPGHLLLSEWVLIDPMTISPQTWQNFSNCPLTQISVSWCFFKWSALLQTYGQGGSHINFCLCMSLTCLACPLFAILLPQNLQATYHL